MPVAGSHRLVLAVVVSFLAFAAGPSHAQSFFTNATCGLPTSELTLRPLEVDLTVVSISGCGVQPAGTTPEVTVSLLDPEAVNYAVGGAVLVTITVERSPSFSAEHLAPFVWPVTRAVRWTNGSDDVASSNATTEEVVSTVSSDQAVIVADLGRNVSFSDFVSSTRHGLYRITVSTAMQVRVLPSGEVAVISGSDTSCDWLRTELPSLAAFPATTATLPVDADTGLAAVLFQVAEAHYALVNTLSCLAFVSGQPLSPVARGNASFFESSIVAGDQREVNFAAVLRCTWPTEDSANSNETTSSNTTNLAATADVTFESPTLFLSYFFAQAAAAPWWELSAEEEQYQVESTPPPLFFTEALLVRPRFASTLVNASLLFVVVPGDVALVESPPASRWSRFLASDTAPLREVGIRITQTSQLLAYTVAPGSDPSAISRRVVRLATGTERWKYVLCGVILALVTAVYIGWHIKQAVALAFKKSKKNKKKNSAPQGAAAVPVTSQGRAPDDSASTGSDDSFTKAHGSVLLLMARYAVWCCADVALVVTDLTFVVTCFSYAGVGMGYQLFYAAAMIVFVGLLLARWHWAASTFEDDEMLRRSGGRGSGSDDDDSVASDDANECLGGRSLMFVPLANLATFPFYLRRTDPVAATVRQREFWGGVIRLCIDVPELIITLVFIVRNPTRTNDASLVKLFFTLASLIFGWRGAVKAGMLAIKEVVRLWNGDDADDDGEKMGDNDDDVRSTTSSRRSDKSKRKEERRRQRGEPKTEAQSESTTPPVPANDGPTTPTEPAMTAAGVPSSARHPFPAQASAASGNPSRQPSAPTSPSKQPRIVSEQPRASAVASPGSRGHSRQPSTSDPFQHPAPASPEPRGSSGSAAQWHPPHPSVARQAVQAPPAAVRRTDATDDEVSQIQQEIEAAVRLRVLRELAQAQTQSLATDDGAEPYAAPSPGPVAPQQQQQQQPRHLRTQSAPSALSSPARAARRDPNARVHFPEGNADRSAADAADAAATAPGASHQTAPPAGAAAAAARARPPPLTFDAGEPDEEPPTFDFHAAADESLDAGGAPDYDV